MTTDKVRDWGNPVLYSGGWIGIIPVEEFFSSDLAEAYTMLSFWIHEGVIRRMEEHEIIRDSHYAWERRT